ncbi:MAG: flagellar hook-length control protein FliK [Gammaproteobacteria bacterium]|nr:flagellar hook-length control protein FliK [Gammaproteobacteria bacterium]
MQPAGTPVPGGAADGGVQPFAALLMGFLQGAQPAAPTTPTIPATPESTATEEFLLPEADAGDTGLPEGLGSAAAIPLAQSATPGIPVTGKALPASGNSLPPGAAGIPAEPSLPAPAAVAAEASIAVPAARISLADIEHSRQLNMATLATPPGDQAGTRRSMPEPVTPTVEPPAASVPTEDSAGMLVDTEIDSTLRQPAGLTAGELSRLVQNLAQNGGRESFSAAFRSDGNGLNAPPGNTGTAAGNPLAADNRLGSMAREALGGFPPLQPLGPAQAWTAGLGDRLLTLAGPGTHSARLKLHPESLGTLDIEIKIADNTAQVWFGAQHSQTREAIEASLPQLREMFAEQGIRLAHAEVGAGTDQRGRNPQQAFNDTETAGNAWRGAAAPVTRPEMPAPIRQAASRLVDAWA